MNEERIQKLNDEEPAQGQYVLYWMQQSQRAHFNHALEHAIRTANQRDEPILVAFGLMDDYPHANVRHYRFMLEGLHEVEADLAERGIKLVVRRGSPDEVALSLAQNASIVVCDRGYLRHQKAWRRRVAREAGRSVIQVESDVVVPIEVASDKAEFAARTLRPKIERVRDAFTAKVSATAPVRKSLRLRVGSDLNLWYVDKALDGLSIDRCRRCNASTAGRVRHGAGLPPFFVARSRATVRVEAIRPRTRYPV
jgi:deoxyribodipyrimidine photo-lyase